MSFIESPAKVIVDVDGNPVGVMFDGVVYRLQTSAKLRAPDDSVDMGDVANPVRIDPTGATRQPIVVADPTSSDVANVSSQNALFVTPIRPRDDDLTYDQLTQYKYLSDAFKDSSGSTALNVNASSAPVTFRVEATSNETRYVKRVKFVLNDQGMNLGSREARKFGSSKWNGLTNGLYFRHVQGGAIYEIFKDPVKRMSDFYIYAESIFNVVNGVSSGVDLVVINIEFDVPLVLPRSSTDYLEIIVNDNLSKVNKFEVYIVGWFE